MYGKYLVFGYNSLVKGINYSYIYFLKSFYTFFYERNEFKCYYHNNEKFYIKPCGSINDLENPNIFLVTLLEDDIELLDYNFTEEFLQVYGPYKNFHNNLISVDEFLSFTNFQRKTNNFYKLKVYDRDFNEYICYEYLNDMKKI
jgi:hypothetical protein